MNARTWFYGTSFHSSPGAPHNAPSSARVSASIHDAAIPPSFGKSGTLVTTGVPQQSMECASCEMPRERLHQLNGQRVCDVCFDHVVTESERQPVQPLPVQQSLGFPSDCCAAPLVLHWACNQWTQCQECRECSTCGRSFEAEAIQEHEERERRTRHA